MLLLNQLWVFLLGFFFVIVVGIIWDGGAPGMDGSQVPPGKKGPGTW
jgi:hypothetical protein